MKLDEAKQILKYNGYSLIKESIELRDFDFTCEYEGTSDYESGDELPSPYVIVTPLKNPRGAMHFLKKHFVNNPAAIQDTVITDVVDDNDFIEFVFPKTDFCDDEMRTQYENIVKSLVNKQITLSKIARLK